MSKEKTNIQTERKPLPKILTRKGTVPVLLLLLILLYGALGIWGYTLWSDSREVFHDVTVELGTPSLSLRDFMTDKASPGRVGFVSDPAQVDLSQVGQHPITLRHGEKHHQVMLTVQDTTAPVISVLPTYLVSVGEEMPQAEDLIREIEDESPVSVSFDAPITFSEDYSSVERLVIAQDQYGNRSEAVCSITFNGWLRDTVTLELGSALTADMVLLNAEKDSKFIEQSQLDAINTAGVGQHTLTVSTGAAEASCTVTVQDTTAPTLVLQTVRKFPGDSVDVSEFVSTATDLSGTPQITMTGEIPDYNTEGKFTVTIAATDSSGNTTSRDTILFIASNLNPPEISGADKELTIEKHSSPDLLTGVTAWDDLDGACMVTVDTSTLNVDAAGTYFVTYSATDNSGNVGTYKRKITVEHDEEDTAARIKELAATMEDDPELIRDYVHDTIAYSSNWGGDDPIWHGLTTSSGNCFVHASVLQALLTEKGYETQMIWVTNKSHYWLIIKLEEGWRHIDSTPSYQHEKVGLGTDKDRYLNLNGRNWDRSKWPACN